MPPFSLFPFCPGGFPFSPQSSYPALAGFICIRIFGILGIFEIFGPVAKAGPVATVGPVSKIGPVAKVETVAASQMQRTEPAAKD